MSLSEMDFPGKDKSLTTRLLILAVFYMNSHK